MSAIVIIPSRYQSTRFPGKPLTLLKGRPMIQHVYERSANASLVEAVFVATDSPNIFDAVQAFGGRAVMTAESHTSGTDRLAEAAKKIAEKGIKADIIVNVQGDEPLIRPEMIDAVISLMEDSRVGIATLVKRVEDPADIMNPNVVKAVFNAEGFALYFSRAPVPYNRDIFASVPEFDKMPEGLVLHKHIGIYAYRADVLQRFSALPPSRLEETEMLEQLRALENGIAIKVAETEYETIGVDTPMDLKRVELCLNTSL